MSKTVNINNQEFKVMLYHDELVAGIRKMAIQLDQDLEGQHPLFLVVLKGAFMFAAELIKAMKMDSEVQFIRAKSYVDKQSSGAVQCSYDEIDVDGRSVVILEDIVDTGNTIEALHAELMGMGASEVKVATLLFKPDAYEKKQPIDYVGHKIENKFVVGFGLDYNEKGRGLKDLYVEV